MDDIVEKMVVSVRADTQGFARDIADMRQGLEGPLASGAEKAGRAIEAVHSRAVASESVQARVAMVSPSARLPQRKRTRKGGAAAFPTLRTRTVVRSESPFQTTLGVASMNMRSGRPRIG